MLRRIKAMAWKESLHIFRDFRTLYLAFILPILMMILFGYAINFDIDNIPIGVCDQDNTKQTREFVRKLTAADWFHLKFTTTDVKQVEKALDQGEIKIALIIPPGFTKRIKRNELSSLDALIDGSNNSSALTGFQYLQAFIGMYQGDLLESHLQKYGISNLARTEILPHILFNPELKSRFYTLPGLIVIIIAIMSALLTSLTLAKEWERGTMEQLISTPVRPFEIVIGKLIPYISISLLQTLMSVAMAVYIFKVPFVGNLFALLFTSLLFSIGVLGLGMAISGALKTQLTAMQAALLATMLPSLFLSNFMFPIESMPPLIRLVTNIIPAKYFLVMIRTIFLKGTGFESYFMDALFLALFCVIIIAIAVKKTGKRIA